MENRALLNDYRLNKYLRFHDWINDVKGFYPYIHELKKYVFRFKNMHIENAKKCLSSLAGNISGFSLTTHIRLNKSKRKLVSIHIRLGDYGSYLEAGFQLPTVNSTYFTRAMDYLCEKYEVSLQFLSNLKWIYVTLNVIPMS